MKMANNWGLVTDEQREKYRALTEADKEQIAKAVLNKTKKQIQLAREFGINGSHMRPILAEMGVREYSHGKNGHKRRRTFEVVQREINATTARLEELQKEQARFEIGFEWDADGIDVIVHGAQDPARFIRFEGIPRFREWLEKQSLRIRK